MILLFFLLQSRISEPTKAAKMTPPPIEEEGESDGAEDEDEDEDEAGAEDEDEAEGTTCGACGDDYAANEFWICCDVCERWFHGKCVKITPAKAEHIKQYKCPSCNHKRARVGM